MTLKDSVKEKIKKLEEDGELSICWYYFLTNCCEIGLNDNIDLCAYFKA